MKQQSLRLPDDLWRALSIAKVEGKIISINAQAVKLLEEWAKKNTYYKEE